MNETNFISKYTVTQHFHFNYYFQTNLQYKTLTWVHSPLMIALQWVSAGDEGLKWPQVKLNLCQTHMKQFIKWPDSLTLHVTPY